ncbi:hypothetical protein D3C75_983730 [compost metagenome]
MNCAAPMSTPRVGCSAMSSCGLVEHSLATTTFCMLPPDSMPIGCCGPEQRTLNSSTSEAARAAILELLRKGPLFNSFERYRVDIRLSAMLASPAEPWRIRSSGI